VSAGGVLVLGGAGAAVAASNGSSTRRQAYLDDVAKHLGVSPGALASAIRAADKERIEAAVKEGRITQAQAQELESRLSRFGHAPPLGTRIGPLGPHGGPLGPHGGPLGPDGGPFDPRAGRGAPLLRVAAAYLGTTVQALHAKREQGISLAQIAESTPGKSVHGLTEALTAAIKSKLDSRVSAGRISPQNEKRLLANIGKRIEALLHRTGPPGPPVGASSGH
jgi:hypothetical protein